MAVHTHVVEVVPVVLTPHPDADSLSIVQVYGWTVVVKTESWIGIDRAAYVQPDSIVDVTRPEFEWLKKTPEDVKPHRVRVIRLRKVISQGLLCKAPEGSQIGDDVTEALGVRHYEPPTQQELDSTRGPSASAEAYTGPNLWIPVYDVESMYRFYKAFVPGERIYVSEKLHGENAKFMWDGERMWAGTRKEWKKPGMGLPWKLIAENSWIEDFCRANPQLILRGEAFGWVQALRYGAQPGEAYFRAFDVLQGTEYWGAQRFLDTFKIEQRVPWLNLVETFDFEQLKELAEGDTNINVGDRNTNPPQKGGSSKPIPNIREGLVVRPWEEHVDLKLGRVILKLVSNNYYLYMKDQPEPDRSFEVAAEVE